MINCIELLKDTLVNLRNRHQITIHIVFIDKMNSEIN